MSANMVREFFEANGMKDSFMHSGVVSDTVEAAAILLGCEPKQIAKTMLFMVGDRPVVVVTSGDEKIDNAKYREYFGVKAKMVPSEFVEKLTGHLPGGVCPFALKKGVEVYLDISLKRFDIVYTGGGDEHSTAKVTVEQLERYSNPVAWIDVCKGLAPASNI